MWKRASDFPAENVRELNERLDTKGDLEKQRAWDTAVSGLEKRGVLVVRHKFTSLRRTTLGATTSGRDLLQVIDRTTLTDFSDASPLVGQLQDAWMSDIQIHAAQAVGGRISAKEILAALSLS